MFLELRDTMTFTSQLELYRPSMQQYGVGYLLLVTIISFIDVACVRPDAPYVDLNMGMKRSSYSEMLN